MWSDTALVKMRIWRKAKTMKKRDSTITKIPDIKSLEAAHCYPVGTINVLLAAYAFVLTYYAVRETAGGRQQALFCRGDQGDGHDRGISVIIPSSVSEI